MSKTSIAWTERTWNPVTGCTKYSAGCAHCYAETMARRLQGMGVDRYKNGFQVTMHPEALDEPKKVKEPSMFFVCSMSDLFHDEVPDFFLDFVMQTIVETPRHIYQILTKRTKNMYNYFAEWWCEGDFDMPQNVWLGTTVENEDAKYRIDVLRRMENVSIKFLSCEPLLSDLGTLDLSGIDWVIVGGESGPQARPMKKEWVLNIKRQCDKQGVPFFFKQWGTYGEDGIKRNKKSNGCLLDGEMYQAWPKGWKGGVK